MGSPSLPTILRSSKFLQRQHRLRCADKCPDTNSTQMQIGMIGLGRIGGNIVRRMTRNDHRCVVFVRNPTAVKALVGEHVVGSTDLKQLVSQLEKPRVVW